MKCKHSLSFRNVGMISFEDVGIDEADEVKSWKGILVNTDSSIDTEPRLGLPDGTNSLFSFVGAGRKFRFLTMRL